MLFTEDEARGKTKKTFPDEGGRVFACTPSCVLVRCRVLCDATLLAGGRFHTRSHMNKGIRTNTHTYAPPRTVFGEEKRTLTSSHFPCQQRAMCFFAAASCCPGWNTKEKRSRGLFCAVSLTDRIRIPSKEWWRWCPVNVWFGLGKANSFPLFFWHTLRTAHSSFTVPSYSWSLAVGSVNNILFLARCTTRFVRGEKHHLGRVCVVLVSAAEIFLSLSHTHVRLASGGVVVVG